MHILLFCKPGYTWTKISRIIIKQLSVTPSLIRLNQLPNEVNKKEKPEPFLCLQPPKSNLSNSQFIMSVSSLQKGEKLIIKQNVLNELDWTNNRKTAISLSFCLTSHSVCWSMAAGSFAYCWDISLFTNTNMSIGTSLTCIFKCSVLNYYVYNWTFTNTSGIIITVLLVVITIIICHAKFKLEQV